MYAEVDLINAEDIALARRNYIGEEEIRQMRVTMIVDTGSYMLAINEHIQSILQFPVVEQRRAELANDQTVLCDVVSGVELRFNKRRCT